MGHSVKKKKFHTEFHENPANGLVTYTKSRMDGRVDVVVHSRFPFLIIYYIILYWYRQYTKHAKTRCFITTGLYLATCFGR